MLVLSYSTYCSFTPEVCIFDASRNARLLLARPPPSSPARLHPCAQPASFRVRSSLRASHPSPLNALKVFILVARSLRRGPIATAPDLQWSFRHIRSTNSNQTRTKREQTALNCKKPKSCVIPNWSLYSTWHVVSGKGIFSDSAGTRHKLCDNTLQTHVGCLRSL